MAAKTQEPNEVEQYWKEIRKEETPKTKNGYVEETPFIGTGAKKWDKPGKEYNPVFCCPSLRQRAINVLKILKTETDNNGIESDMSDFLSDMMHLAYQADLDFDELIERARTNFDGEISGIY